VSIKVTKHLEKILESLKGSIEYEDPIYGLKVIDGSFKLQNDPKVMRIREENVLFCGSKIYTSWIIGIVLYNGKNTKIFRHNFKHDADLSKVV
jgi:magnesium-transporting ATPase (P-type)